MLVMFAYTDFFSCVYTILLPNEVTLLLVRINGYIQIFEQGIRRESMLIV